MQKKNKTPIKLFVLAFAVIAAVTVYQNLSRQKIISLQVKDNKGTSFLETAGDRLVCIFQDGQVCLWDWNHPHTKQGEFRASPQAMIVDPGRMAAVNPAGKKQLTFYSLPEGVKQKEFSVGWEDQEVWPRISFDKSAIAVIRKNPTDSSGRSLYEFLTLDLANEITGQPVSLEITDKTEVLVDFAVSSEQVLVAVGSRSKTGRIAAVNLQTGSLLWDRVFEGTKEFCSVIVSPDNRYLLAGNRDGLLYKISTAEGRIEKQIALLEPGETRPVTNDYSVLNLAFSPDGQYYVATINPPAYVLEAGIDRLIHTFAPADKLVSKIAFSPDNRHVASSDIRAGYPIKIWPLPKEE